MDYRMMLNELTRDEVREVAPRATLVLPVASTEQHGPHLALKTDLALGEAVALGAAARASAAIPVVVAPSLPYGNSPHHLVYSAASLRSSTLIAVLNDLVDSLVASGFRRFFLINGHGGNDECVKLLCKDVVLRHDVAIAACSYWHVAEKAVRAVAGDKLRRYPGHSGWFETSMMLAVAPDLVRQDRFPSVDPNPPSLSHQGLVPGGVVQRAGDWARTGGYTDAPTGADAEMGRKMLEAIVQVISDALVAFHQASYGEG